ncbi:MAG: FAD-dependent oxidoreductase, partial [Alphaproteobacteria bacterium]|nr:FAD-dependent oxidoreductase [Alphaproteobacteria bacterium]
LLFFVLCTVWHEYAAASEGIEAAASLKKTVIIGAGLTGLSAYKTLNESGIPADIYEARDRAGGRILTHTFPDGKRSELGATFVGGGHKAMQKLCAELGVILRPLEGFSLHIIGDDGGPLGKDQQKEVHELISAIFNKKYPLIEKEGESIGSVIKRAIGNSPVASASYGVIRLVFADETGLDIERIPAEMIEPTWSAIAKEAPSLLDRAGESFTVQEGTNALVDALKKGIYIHYNHILEKVSSVNGQYELSFKNGKAVMADRVIIAVPLSVLKTIEFPESLGGLSKGFESVGVSIPYGGLQRDVLPEDPNLDDPSKSFYEINLKDNYVAWPGGIGTKTITRLSSDDKPIERVIDHLDWKQDQFSQGCYSNDFAYHAVKELFANASPLPGLVFAGEYLSPNEDFVGYMEGAVLSGQEAVRRLIEARS